MKKVILTICVLALILTSCSIDGLRVPEKPNKNIQKSGPDIDTSEGGTGGESITYRDDLENNINYIDVNVDMGLTKDFISEANGKKDILFQNNMANKDVNRPNTDRLTNSINVAGNAQMYVTLIPDDIDVDLLYKEYNIPLDYLLITSEDTNIYSEPNLDSDVLGKAEQLSKVKLEGKATFNYLNQTNEWYLLSWIENGNTTYGYVTVDKGVPRKFRFDKMSEEIKSLEFELEKYQYGYISNYKDRNGSPPLINGKAVDSFGIQAYQSAPAYYSLENKNEFRYFPDGMLVSILDEDKGHFKVKNLAYEGEYWIPKQFISFDDNLDNLNKVIVVDKTNQNEALFENRNGRWTMISYTLATTGMPEENKYETPTGSFKVLQKRDKFYYLNHRTNQIAGYAPYGTRFSAGAYVHGIPVEYKVVDGEKIDPGMKEYLVTIGTTPRSAKCVRNYTSHAKFVYDWADMNDTAVIIMD
ncbi:MAG: L,D-transpeptidase [Gottschalkiaceae bacterium]|nr:MAG: L,D-transpeptidase [Gottschalkiaceae bacterium]